MNPFDRAKSFIAGRVARLALAVLPLVAIAVIAPPTARATGIVLDVGGDDTCFLLVGDDGSCIVSQVETIGGDSNANWIQVSSTTLTPSGGDLDIGVFGSANGASAYTGEMIPVSWDFTIDNPDDISGGTATWYLDFGIYGNDGCGSGGVCETDALDSNTAALGSVVSGTDFIAVTGGGEVDGYTIQLAVSADADNDPFTVTLPTEDTLDLNPASVSVAPEPASLLLACAGGALLLLRRKKFGPPRLGR